MIKIEENSHCNVEITGQTSFLFLGSSDDDSFNRQNKEINLLYEFVEICHHYTVSTTFIEKSYIVFTIKTKLKSNENIYVVDRRFSDFEWLHNYFLNFLDYQGLILPKIPEKHGISKSITTLISEDEEFIFQRKKDLEKYLKKLLAHYMLSNDQILQNFLCLSSEEFKFFQKNQKEKEKNDYSLNATTFSDINKIYDYAQAYLKTSLTASILKNKSYETIEIDVLMDKVRKYEENLLNLITQLEIFSKIERNYLLSKEPLNENVFESVEKWNIYLNSEKNGLEEFPINEEDLIKEIFEILQNIEMAKNSYFVLNKSINDLSINIILCEEKVNQSLKLSKERKYFLEESHEISDLKEDGSLIRKKISIIEKNLKRELKIFLQNLNYKIREISKFFMDYNQRKVLKERKFYEEYYDT